MAVIIQCSLQKCKIKCSTLNSKKKVEYVVISWKRLNITFTSILSFRSILSLPTSAPLAAIDVINHSAEIDEFLTNFAIHVHDSGVQLHVGTTSTIVMRDVSCMLSRRIL